MGNSLPNIMPPDNFRRQFVRIQDVDWNNSTGQIKAYVLNGRDSEITLNQVYVNGTLDSDAAIVPQVLSPNQTAEITLSETYVIIPRQITIEVYSANGSLGSFRKIFIGFEMLRLYWNQTNSQIRVLVTNIGDYPHVDFSRVYVNGTLDGGVVITQISGDPRFRTYEVLLSGKYVSKPEEMLLKITMADGTSFELESPFSGIMQMSLIKWDSATGQIKFLVYIPSARSLEGERDIIFDEVYVNGTLDDEVVITRPYSETYEIVLSKIYAVCPSQVTVKVVTDFGAFCEESDSNLMDTIPDRPYGELMITGMQFSTGYITIIARNTGTEVVTVDKVLINDVERNVTPFEIPAQEQRSLKISYQWVSRCEYTVFLISSEGNVSFPDSAFAP